MSNPGCFKSGCYNNCPHECDWKIGRLTGYQQSELTAMEEKYGFVVSNGKEYLRIII